MKLGFVGLGNMGRPMARRLLQGGFQLAVYDADATAAAELEEAGASVMASAAAVAAEAEVIFVSLPTPEIVEKVLIGPDGLGQGQARVIVDLSTTGPESSRKVAHELKARGITLIDAPVSGGTVGAEAGSLTIMAAGDPEIFEEMEPALSQIGSNIFYLGSEPGQAQTVKLVNNMMLAAATVTAFEGLVLGAKAGVNAERLLEVINVSSGRSFATEVKIAQCVLDRSFPMRFSTALLAKDVRLCLEEGDRQGVPMRVSKEVQSFLADCIANGYAAEDYGTLIKPIEVEAGAQFGTKKDK